MDKTPREMFKALATRYDEVEKRFFEFRRSPIGREHKETVDDFIHEGRRLAGKVGYSLLKGKLPVDKRPDMLWATYNHLLTSIGLMELILELWDGEED